MSNTIPAPKMSEILREEFMEPLGVLAYKLARPPCSHVPDTGHSP